MSTIHIYNQSVSLHLTDMNEQRLIQRFLSSFYTQYGNAFTKGNVTVAPNDKVYACINEDRTIYTLHRNQFRHLLQYMEQSGRKFENVEKVDHRDYPAELTDVKVREGWVPREAQAKVIDFLLDPPTYSKLVPIQTGQGKAIRLDGNIKIPGGWAKMGDMKVGTKVTTQDGSATKVNGVFPQGELQMYKITFSDGRHTECCLEHLWKVYFTSLKVNRPFCASSRVTTTKDLLRLFQIPTTNVYVDLPESEDYEDIELPIHPYLLGGFLARGLHPLGLTDDGKTPNIGIYLNSSKEQRTNLLQGLVNVHGKVGRFGVVKYIHSDLELCSIVQYLVRALGGIAKLTVKNDTYTLWIRMKKPSQLFLMSKDPNRIIGNAFYNKNLKLKIVSIEKTTIEQAQCISVEHPSKLYVTDDFIVTHNTFIALNALSRMNTRVAVCILPTFIEKWVSDISTILDVKSKEIMVVQGGKNLAGIIDMGKERTLESPFIIFSANTMYDFVKLHYKSESECLEKYGCSPLEMMPLLGVGVMLIDEGHMSYHSVFKTLINSNVKQLIGLSATMMADDSVVKRMHQVVYPKEHTYVGFGYDKYIDVYPISYNVNNSWSRHIRTTEYGSNNYSHTAYEKSITKIPQMKARYFNLIKSVADDYYIEEYLTGDKLIVFVSTVKIATDLTEYFRRIYPHLTTERYCEEDDYDNVIKPDIRVTTVLSAGTGVDVPNLRCTIQTISVSSSVSNLQTLGRLRKLKDRDVKFCYLYNAAIPKHIDYHKKRKEIFADKVNSIVDRASGVSV